MAVLNQEKPEMNPNSGKPDYLKLPGVVKLSAGGQSRGNFCAPNGVTTRHPNKISSSSGSGTPMENLIRKLVAQVSSELEAISNERDDRKGQVIIDTEIDGVRCLLTRLDKPPAPRISFSPRESEIARMVAQGYPNKTIAAALDISPWTVCTHLRRIFAKLKISSRSAMVAQLIAAGVVNDIL
jgi:DNA-binding CsgD family transcriptional regulator